MHLSQDKAIELIKKLIDEIGGLKDQPRYGEMHTAWLQTSLLNISMIFGKTSGILSNLSNVSYSLKGTAYGKEFEDPQVAIDRVSQEAYLKGLDSAKGVLSSALKSIETWGLEKMQEKSIAKTGVKVFISHGGETKALRKIETFIRSLDLKPIIVKEQPSKGKSVNPNVRDYLNDSDCVLILATADDKVDGIYQPRPNVIHEVGLAEDNFKDKLIYLLEDNCTLPSNFDEKVYQRFNQQDLSPAFEKIIRELTAFGFISPSIPNQNPNS